MKYVYRNKTTKGIVELTKPRAEFEDSSDWERLEGEAPQREPDPDPIEVPTGSNPDGDGDTTLSTQDVVNLVCDNLEEFEDGQLEHLQSAVSEKLNARVTAPSVETAQVAAGDPESDAVEAKGDETGGDETGSTDKAEIDATAAASDLAKKEGVDLSTVKGSGDDGRILLGDVRDAVEAKGD